MSDNVYWLRLELKLRELRKYINKREEISGKYYFPLSVLEGIKQAASKHPENIKIYYGQLLKFIEADGKLPYEAGKLLEEAYLNDELILGRHSGGLWKEQLSKNNFMFRYKDNDVTSTIVFSHSLESGVEQFTFCDFVEACSSKEKISSYKGNNNLTIFAFPVEIFKDEAKPIWKYNETDGYYYLLPQFILGSFYYDYEQEKIAFIKNPAFNPSLEYDDEGLVYDEFQTSLVNDRRTK